MQTNLQKLGNYVEVLNINNDVVWVTNPTEDLFIKADLSDMKDFQGMTLINLQDFISKLDLFMVNPKEDLPFIKANVTMHDDYIELDDGNKKMNYPFSSFEKFNDEIMNGESGETFKIKDILPAKLEKLESIKHFELDLTESKYKELLKLANSFKSNDETFKFVGRDGKLYFYCQMPNGTNFKLELADIPFSDFKNFEHSIIKSPHIDDWKITFFDGMDYIIWSSDTSIFEILMAV